MWALILALIALCFFAPELADLHDALHHPTTHIR
jgi:hypothetical protein